MLISRRRSLGQESLLPKSIVYRQNYEHYWSLESPCSFKISDDDSPYDVDVALGCLNPQFSGKSAPGKAASSP